MLTDKEIREIEKLEEKIAELEAERNKISGINEPYEQVYIRPDSEIVSKMVKPKNRYYVANQEKYNELTVQIKTLQYQIDSIRGRARRETAKERRAEEDRRMAYVEAHVRYIEQSIFKRALQTLTGKSFKAVAKKDNLTTDEIKGLYR